MTDTPAKSELAPRLVEFQREVDALKVTGGKANPERNGMIFGVVVMIASIVIAIIAYSTTHSSVNSADWADGNALGNIAIALAVVGATFFFVFSIRRYLRYWLIRLIYEIRGEAKG